MMEAYAKKPLALIIEDDPKLGDIFSLALQTDFDTELCNNGSSGLSRLEQEAPDIVVLDLHLPGVSGQEILAFVRASPHLAKTHVILATADHIQADFLHDDAEIVLLKPINPFQLTEIAVRLTKR